MVTKRLLLACVLAFACSGCAWIIGVTGDVEVTDAATDAKPTESTDGGSIDSAAFVDATPSE